MRDQNFFHLVGRLTRDPELSYTAGNKALCKFSIACNRGKGEDEVDFFELNAWEKLADIVAQYAKKGQQVICSGRIRQNRWVDKEGQKRSKIDFTASDVQLVGRSGAAEGGAPPSPARPAQRPPARPAGAPANDPIDFEPLGEDEVPF